MFGSTLVRPNKADSFILFIHACLKFWLSLILCETAGDVYMFSELFFVLFVNLDDIYISFQ